MTYSRRHHMCSLVLVSSAILSGCATSNRSADHSTPAPGYTQTASGTVVPVSITEHHIVMPARIPPGQTTLQITNNTKHQRELKITGDGVNASLFTAIDPGATGEMLVNLHPGQYTVTALDGTHMSPGVSAQLTVTQP
jgi:hypothetical protein